MFVYCPKLELHLNLWVEVTWASVLLRLFIILILMSILFVFHFNHNVTTLGVVIIVIIIMWGGTFHRRGDPQLDSTYHDPHYRDSPKRTSNLWKQQLLGFRIMPIFKSPITPFKQPPTYGNRPLGLKCYLTISTLNLPNINSKEASD